MAETAPKYPRWRLYALFVVGMVAFLSGLVVAHRAEVGSRLRVDFDGVQTKGSVERMGPAMYRLRYTHPSGAIYTRSYKGRVGVSVDDRHASPLSITYNPGDPQSFQPTGASYIPGAIVLLLCSVGASLVFYANHRLLRRSLSKRP